MFKAWSSTKSVLVAIVAALFFAMRAQATFIQQFQVSGATVPSDSSLPISAKAVFTTDAKAHTITLQLTNLTVDPARPCQLLTGISFSIVNPTVVSNLQLVSATTMGCVVNSGGTYQDFGPVDLVALNTWSMGDSSASPSPLLNLPSSGIYNSTFHPNAQYGILGSPGSDNLYDEMVLPDGQTPYSDESITFKYSSSSIGANTSIAQITFGFGTNFESTLSAVPEGSAFLPLVGILALAGAVQFARHRQAALKLATSPKEGCCPSPYA